MSYFGLRRFFSKKPAGHGTPMCSVCHIYRYVASFLGCIKSLVCNIITVNAEKLACRKFGDFVGNQVGLNINLEFGVYGMDGHYVRSCNMN